MYIGHIGGAHVPQIIIRAFLPEGIRGKRSYHHSKCPTEFVKTFYDEGLYPAVLEVLPREVHTNWPTSYDDHEWRSRKRSGHLTHTSHGVKQAYLDPLFQALYKNIDTKPALTFAKKMILQVQVQNTKDATRHPPSIFSRPIPQKQPRTNHHQNQEHSSDEEESSSEEDFPDEEESPELAEFVRIRGAAMSDAV